MVVLLSQIQEEEDTLSPRPHNPPSTPRSHRQPPDPTVNPPIPLGGNCPSTPVAEFGNIFPLPVTWWQRAVEV